MFLGPSTEVTEVRASGVTSPSPVVWDIAEPARTDVLLPREGCVLRFTEVTLCIFRDIMSLCRNCHAIYPSPSSPGTTGVGEVTPEALTSVASVEGPRNTRWHRKNIFVSNVQPRESLKVYISNFSPEHRIARENSSTSLVGWRSILKSHVKIICLLAS